MSSLRLTTNQGIEDVAAREVKRLLSAADIPVSEIVEKPGGQEGVVCVEGVPATDAPTRARIREALAHARSIYHVVIHTGTAIWHGQPLDELAGEIAALPLPEMRSAKSFRVTCSRLGNHPFHSPDVERAVGAALQARYGTAVSLEQYDLNIRVDITGPSCQCGYQLTGKKGLDRRYRWKYHPRVTLRTTVAYAMLEIAGFRDAPGALHDPFCGSGTILLEAAALSAAGGGLAVAGGAPAISGSDRDPRAVAGCRANLDANGCPHVQVRLADAREMADTVAPESLDYIVTNPPYGIRMGQSSNFGDLYSRFLHQAAIVLRQGGVLALLVGRRRGRFNKVLQSTPEFRLRHVRIIEIGGVYPGLFVLERVAGV